MNIHYIHQVLLLQCMSVILCGLFLFFFRFFRLLFNEAVSIETMWCR